MQEDSGLYPLTKTTEFRLKLYPKDFSKTRDFYENVLGYPIVKSWEREDDSGVMFDTGVAIIELLTPEIGFVPIQGSDVSLQVADVWALWEKLKDSDIVTRPLRVNIWGDTSFRISDPEGFQITFFTTHK